MIKNIYIGDIHGLGVWKEIVDKHPDANNIVFIGDYFDSFNIGPSTQLKNMQDILRFKKESNSNPNQNVYLLIGNHDIHYWPNIQGRGATSGYQPKMLLQYEQLLRDNEKEFQMAVLVGKNLCTHAGVSSVFLEDVGFWKQDNVDESHIAEYLNDLFKYKPNMFSFSSGAERNYGMGMVNGYGDNEWQSPIWIRPRSLQSSNKKTDLKKNYIQIVGHTQQEDIDIKGKSTGGKYYYIDTLPSGQYLVEVDGEFSVDHCTIEKYI